jgi:putative hydrolase of HD superfamily
MNTNSDRLNRQLKFIIEVDKIKHIFRKTKLFDATRFENDAEHAWHLGLMVLVLSEYSNEPGIDILKVLKMVLIHDIVEIDSGDTIVYDIKNRALAEEKEKMAAERIFSILPADQKSEFKALWLEFEKRKTAEAKFAAALDRFEPILQNHLTGCFAWKKHGITAQRLNAVNHHIEEGSKKIWEIVQQIFLEATEKGDIKKGEDLVI